MIPWRTRPDVASDQNGRGVFQKRPHAECDRHGHGVFSQINNIDIRGGKGVSGERASILAWISALSNRLRRVKVVCGDWSRITSPTATFLAGPCAVFLDPPYADTAGRDPDLYREESATVAHDVREWAIEAGQNPLMRIALCGYEGEHVMPEDWECVAWTAQGGYGNQRKAGENINRKRERIWFSPHCLRPEEMLFGR